MQIRGGPALAHLANDIRPGLYLVSAVCGIIDSTCILSLGGVFAEMMTGNLLLMTGQKPEDIPNPAA